MELMKINDTHEGLYFKDGQMKDIKDIKKEDILELVKLVAENDDITMDQLDDINNIDNPIAKTIYEQLYNELNDLNANRDLYLEDVKKKFEKYETDQGFLDS